MDSRTNLPNNFKYALRTSLPVLFGFMFLGIGYGLYMHNLGFSFLFPTLMAATIYGGSVEFFIANMLLQQFNPVSVLLLTAVLGFRQFFLWSVNVDQISAARMAKVGLDLRVGG